MTAHRLGAMCLAACSALCTLQPSPAHAQPQPPPACSLAKFAFLGERVQHEVASGGTLYYKTNVRAGRSYALFVWAPEQSADLSLDLFSERTCSTPAVEAAPLPFEPSVTGAAPFRVGTQTSIVPAVSGELFIRVRHTSPLAPLIVNTLVIETTLFSPWWFTGGTNQAFIEIRNNMADPRQRASDDVSIQRRVCGTTSCESPATATAAVRSIRSAIARRRCRARRRSRSLARPEEWRRTSPRSTR